MAVFTTSPADFNRFISLTRSTSASLSPERELMQMTRADVHSLLQCGCPLYDPVTEYLQCWGGHPLSMRERAEYGNVEGISCDFCGFTDWLASGAEPQKAKEGKRSRKLRVTATGEAATPALVEPSSAPDSRFLHCSECQMDLCLSCAADIRLDIRFHVPCMQCSTCYKFVRDEDAVLHRCSDVETGAPLRNRQKRSQSEAAPPAENAVAERLREADLSVPNSTGPYTANASHGKPWRVRVDGPGGSVLPHIRLTTEDAVHSNADDASVIVATNTRLRSEEVARAAKEVPKSSMAVVEVGWTVRAGYIGDVHCTRQYASLTSSTAPQELDLCHILASAVGKPASDQADDTITRLWSLEAVRRDVDAHVGYLRRVVRESLRCRSRDPLMLVLPETWLECFDVVRTLATAILEAGDVTSAVYFGRPSTAWTFSCGRTSALVVDAGHALTTTAAVVDGFALRSSIRTSTLAGHSVSNALMNLLPTAVSTEHTLFSPMASAVGRAAAVEDVINDLKREVCTVSPRWVGGTPSAAGDAAGSERVCLPDGTSLLLSAAQCTLPYEVLFATHRTGAGTHHSTEHAPEAAPRSITELVVESKDAVDAEVRAVSIPHLLCGGTARAPGFSPRLLHELQAADSTYYHPDHANCLHVADSDEGAWVGASLTAESSAFTTMWISGEELAEFGDGVLYRKLFL